MGSLSPNRRPTVETEMLPLAIKTLTIDGKRMTTTFCRQIVMDDLLDEETGEMRGVPLGFVEIHQKEKCPDCWHKHILWVGGHGLRHAIVVLPQDARAYRVRLSDSKKGCEYLFDALALLLARSHRVGGLPLLPEYFTQGSSRHHVAIDGQELDVTSEVYKQLARLERARTVRDEALQGRKRRIEGEPSVVPSRLDTQRARQLQRHLASEGIELAHPELVDQTLLPDGKYVRLNSYPMGGIRLPRHTRSVQGNWVVCKIDDPATLYWRSTEHPTDDATDQEAEAIESRIKPSLFALRLLLAEQAFEYQIQLCEKHIRTWAEKSALLTMKKDSLPDASTLQRALSQEHQRFLAYTERWQQNVSALEALDQLFLI